MTPSRTHLVVIPSYNPGPAVVETVQAARANWAPVWVVVDGSTDGSAALLDDLASRDAHLRVLVLPENRGKGAAVLHGLEAARARARAAPSRRTPAVRAPSHRAGAPTPP